MAVPTRTIGELINRLAHVVEGRNTADETLRPNYVFALQLALDELIAQNPLHPSLEKAGTVAVSGGGSATQSLADDCLTPIVGSFYYRDGNPATGTTEKNIPYVTEREVDQQHHSSLRRGTTGDPRFFTITQKSSGNLQIQLMPPPSGDYTVNYRYFSSVDRFESDTDGTTVIDSRIPVQYHAALVNGAAVTLFPQRLSSQELAARLQQWNVAKRDWARYSTEMGHVYRRQSPRRRYGSARWPHGVDSYAGYTGSYRGPGGFYS